MGNYCCVGPVRCANASTPFHSEKQQSGKNFSSSSSTPRKSNPAAPNSSSTNSFTSTTTTTTTKGDSTHAVGLKPFSLSDLKAATKNFRSETLLGEGGFGFVFKGWIDEATHAPTKPGSGVVVAVKKLKRESFQGHKEWLAEVTYLGQLHHENLVKLIGYCMESDHRLLVYEYMQRGSLENHLFKKGAQPFSWATRVHIAIGVARGLVFLHNLENQVIFRDLKASNILLDTDYNAKLSDFGLARNGPTGDRTHVSTRVVGTRGYAAPEYVATGHLSVKSDIYSFGVVLLELMSGRRALDEERGVFEETLVEWAKPFLRDKRKLLRIMDTRLEGQYAKRGAQELAAIAERCLDSDAKARPNMVDVLPSLEKLHSSRALARHGVQVRR